MGLFDKFFNRNAVPGYENLEPRTGVEYANINNDYITIPRNDGTVLQIKPSIDQDGQHMLKEIFDSQGRLLASVPEYTVFEQNDNGEFRHHRILMEVSKEYLDAPYYANFIANELLSDERLHQKVLNNYHGYAGSFSMDENGYVTGKTINKDILKSLEHEAVIEKNKRESREQMEAKKLIDEIRNSSKNVADYYRNGAQLPTERAYTLGKERSKDGIEMDK